MRKTTKKKVAPIVVTALVILYVAPLMVTVLAMGGILSMEGGPALLIPTLLWAVLGGAVIVGILRALRERLREIDGGEEEDASQY